MKRVAEKLDILLWILSVPLIPMIIAEFTMDLTPDLNALFKAYYLILWFIFTVEFAINFFLAEDRMAYLRARPLDILVIVTPALRAVKVFRVLRFPIILLSDRVLGIFGRIGLNFFYYISFFFVMTLVGGDFVFFFF